MTLESEPHMPPSLTSSVAINTPLCSFRNVGRQKSHIVYATMDTKNWPIFLYLPIYKHRIKRRKVDLSHHEQVCLYYEQTGQNIFTHSYA